MFVRLAFSVVTSVDPDILIVDEALSVGDQHFQKKSMDRMMTFKEQGKALIFCSHSLYHVKELCNRAIWMDRGTVQAQGKSGDVIDKYNDHVRMQNRVSVSVPNAEIKKNVSEENEQLTAQITDVTLLDAEYEGNEVAIYQTGDVFRVRVMAEKQSSLALDDVHIGIIIKRNDGVQCFGVSTAVDDVSLFVKENNELGVVYDIPMLNLLSGQYSLEIWLIDSTSAHIYDSIKSCCDFKVKHPSTEVGVTYMPHRWSSPE